MKHTIQLEFEVVHKEGESIQYSLNSTGVEELNEERIKLAQKIDTSMTDTERLARAFFISYIQKTVKAAAAEFELHRPLVSMLIRSAIKNGRAGELADKIVKGKQHANSEH